MQSRGGSKSSFGSGKGKGKGKGNGKGMRWQKAATPSPPAAAPASPSSSCGMRAEAPIFVNIPGVLKDQLFHLAGEMAAKTMYDVSCPGAYQPQYYPGYSSPYAGYVEAQYYQPALQQSAYSPQDYGAAGYSNYAAYAPASARRKGGSTMPKKVNVKADSPPRGQGRRPLPAGAVATASPASSPSLNPAAAPFMPASAVLDAPSQGGADIAAGRPAASAPEPEAVAEAAPTDSVAPTDAVPDAAQQVPPSTSGVTAAVPETPLPGDVPAVVAFLEAEEEHADAVELKTSEPGKLTWWGTTKAAFGNRRHQLLIIGLAAGTAITAASIIKSRQK